MPSHNDIALYRLAPPGEPPALAGFDLLQLTNVTMGLPETGTPHRHDYHEILIVQEGSLLHTVDGQVFTLGRGEVGATGQGRIHLMLQMSTVRGWIVRFVDDLLLATPGSVEAGALARLFSPVSVVPSVGASPDELAGLDALCRVMADELRREQDGERAAVVRHALLAMVLRLSRLVCVTVTPDERMATPEYRVFQEFLLALERDFRAHHDVGHYAEAVGLSASQLARVLGQAVGKAPKQLIGERLALEGKRLLTYTNRSVKEISHELGYRDQFQFSKAFKAQTGLPPQAIREL